MISYKLECSKGHDFESLFSNEAGYEKLLRARQIICPHCGDSKIAKTLSAPRLSTSRMKSKIKGDLQNAHQKLSQRDEKLQEIADYVKDNFEDVGQEFPEQARKIFYGEQAAKPIRGEAKIAEVKELIEEGVPIAPLPAKLFSKGDI